MTIDIKDISVGDAVLIEGVVSKLNVGDELDVRVALNGGDCIWISTDQIKQVIKKPFDWVDAKQGMAFMSKRGHVVYLVMNNNYFSAEDDGYAIVSECADAILSDDIISTIKSVLTRYPQGDLPCVNS